MATIPEAGPMWWDREVDEQGRPIRADVRRAAHELWPEAVRRVRRTLSDPAEAAELMEITVLQISHHADCTIAWRRACPDTSPEALMFPTFGRGERTGQKVPRHAKNFLKWRIYPITDKLKSHENWSPFR